MNTNLKIALDSRAKLEFYFLGLVFTVLALSIQTDNVERECFQFVFEIGAWIVLLISGLAGLSRMEWIPVIYKQHADKQNDEYYTDVFGRKNHQFLWQDTGKLVTPEERVKSVENLKNKIDKRQNYINRTEKLCYVKSLASHRFNEKSL